MSDEERGGDATPALVSEAYDSSASVEEVSSQPEGNLEIEETEHSDILSYETVSETPLDSSSELLERSSQSQEIFPQAARDLEPASQDPPGALANNLALAADDLEGKHFVFSF